jgi:hypothetical protein
MRPTPPGQCRRPREPSMWATRLANTSVPSRQWRPQQLRPSSYRRRAGAPRVKTGEARNHTGKDSQDDRPSAQISSRNAPLLTAPFVAEKLRLALRVDGISANVWRERQVNHQRLDQPKVRAIDIDRISKRIVLVDCGRDEAAGIDLRSEKIEKLDSSLSEVDEGRIVTAHHGCCPRRARPETPKENRGIQPRRPSRERTLRAARLGRSLNRTGPTTGGQSQHIHEVASGQDTGASQWVSA